MPHKKAASLSGGGFFHYNNSLPFGESYRGVFLPLKYEHFFQTNETKLRNNLHCLLKYTTGLRNHRHGLIKRVIGLQTHRHGLIKSTHGFTKSVYGLRNHRYGLIKSVIGLENLLTELRNPCTELRNHRHGVYKALRIFINNVKLSGFVLFFHTFRKN